MFDLFSWVTLRNSSSWSIQADVLMLTAGFQQFSPLTMETSRRTQTAQTSWDERLLRQRHFCKLASIKHFVPWLWFQKILEPPQGSLRTLLQITQSCFEFCCFHILSDADSFWMQIKVWWKWTGWRKSSHKTQEFQHVFNASHWPLRIQSVNCCLDAAEQEVYIQTELLVYRLHIRCSWSHWLIQCWIKRFSILLFELMVHLHSFISCNNNY